MTFEVFTGLPSFKVKLQSEVRFTPFFSLSLYGLVFKFALVMVGWWKTGR